MKGISVLVLSLLVSNANASWTSIKCSNSDGSVRWKSGHNDDFIHLKYSNFVEGVLTLEIEKVNIQFSKEVTLREKTFKNCQHRGKGRVFAGQVKIVASEKYPDVLRGQFPENQIQTDVICTSYQVGSKNCP